MIPSATGLSPKGHHAQQHGGEPAPKRVTKEFFKDLLAGGIAGADAPCQLESADEEALISYTLYDMACIPFARRTVIGGATGAQGCLACVSSSCIWTSCTCR